MEKDSAKDSVNDEQPDLLLQKIKDYLFTIYNPVLCISPDVILMSTHDIYEALQRFYPSELYGQADIARWLHQSNFEFVETGKMRFEWMMLPASL